MLALTIPEPGLWAFTDAGKRIENLDARPEDWGVELKRGDPIALHAGPFSVDLAIDLSMMLAEDEIVVPGEEQLDMGAIGAVARFWGVARVIPETSIQTRWRTDTKCAWIFDQVWRLPTRVPCPGGERLWELDLETRAEVDHQWGKCERPAGLF